MNAYAYITLLVLAPGLLQEPPEPPAHPLAGGGGPVLPAPGGHAAAVGAALGVAHHLPHLYQDAVHAGPQPEPRPRALLLDEAVAGGREAELGGGHLVLVSAAAPAQVPHPATHRRQHQQGDETCSILGYLHTISTF